MSVCKLLFKKHKPSRRFVACRLDADDTIIGPVVVGNVGDNSVSSYRQHAPETQQLADATPICNLCGVAMTGRLATHPGNTTVKV